MCVKRGGSRSGCTGLGPPEAWHSCCRGWVGWGGLLRYLALHTAHSTPCPLILNTAEPQVARLFLDSDALVVRTEGKARASAAPITAPGPAATAGARQGRGGLHAGSQPPCSRACGMCSPPPPAAEVALGFPELPLLNLAQPASYSPFPLPHPCSPAGCAGQRPHRQRQRDCGGRAARQLPRRAGGQAHVRQGAYPGTQGEGLQA